MYVVYRLQIVCVDRYWLYVVVQYKCVFVINDEMWDYLFYLFGNDFFFKWKECYQVDLFKIIEFFFI